MTGEPLTVARLRVFQVQSVLEYATSRAEAAVIPPGQDGNVILLIGLPASGRSSIAMALGQAMGALVVDPNFAATRIPNYLQAGLTGVHPETVIIAQLASEVAVFQRRNIVIQIVGKNDSDLFATITALNRAGHMVWLALSDVSPEEASRRAFNRNRGSGRYVPLEYILDELGTRPRETFDKLKGIDEIQGRYVRFDQEAAPETSLRAKIAEYGSGFDPRDLEVRRIAQGCVSPLSPRKPPSDWLATKLAELRYAVQADYPRNRGEKVEEYMERTMPEVIMRMPQRRGVG